MNETLKWIKMCCLRISIVDYIDQIIGFGMVSSMS